MPAPRPAHGGYGTSDIVEGLEVIWKVGEAGREALFATTDRVQVMLGSAIMIPFLASAAIHIERLREAQKIGPPRQATPKQKISFKIWKRKKIMQIRDSAFADLAGTLKELSLRFVSNPYAQGLVLYAGADHLEKLHIIDSGTATALKTAAGVYMTANAIADIIPG